LALPASDLDVLAARFCLTPGQISESIALASISVTEQGSDSPTAAAGAGTLGAFLFATARRQSAQDLGKLAHKRTAIHTWDDLVLQDDVLAQLREMCRRVVHSHRVFGQWGFDRKLSLGRGVSALFTGPPGVGKTAAASAVAHELRMDLYEINLAGVVSKYIGETERNLDRVLEAAHSAILAIHEGEAILGKRTAVHDQHDRYGNLEIAYLLQKLEEHEGVVIVTTNLRGNLDNAFTRRLSFIVHFPFPSVADRRRIWDVIWPKATPLAEDVDLEYMAAQFPLAGGHIKNIALAAAFLAAEDGGCVTMGHLLRATRRELQKVGKVELEILPIAATERGLV
jgi:SpoVK/Ycf46/Vps4 family AAA+-type ATPase